MLRIFSLVLLSLCLFNIEANALRLFSSVEKLETHPLIGKQYVIKEDYIAYKNSFRSSKAKKLGSYLNSLARVIHSGQYPLGESEVLTFLPRGNTFTVKHVYRQIRSTFLESFLGKGDYILVFNNRGKSYTMLYSNYDNKFESPFRSPHSCGYKGSCKRLPALVKKCQKVKRCPIFMGVRKAYELPEKMKDNKMLLDVLSKKPNEYEEAREYLKKNKIKFKVNTKEKGISVNLTALELVNILARARNLNLDSSRIDVDKTNLKTNIYPKNKHIKKREE